MAAIIPPPGVPKAATDERLVTVDLGDDLKVVVVAQQVGPEFVADNKLMSTLEGLTGPIERVCTALLKAVKSAEPTKAAVELGFDLAIEQGQLIALFGKGKAEASIKVTLEWAAGARPAAS